MRVSSAGRSFTTLTTKSRNTCTREADANSSYSSRGSHGPSPQMSTEATVAQRIRSDALRDLGLSTKDVDVLVEEGFATLRGSVATIDEADRLVSRVRKVPGVKDVSAEVRVAEEYVAGE